MAKYVVEWDADLTQVINVWPWEDWIHIPVEERPWQTARVVSAKDELDAYMRATEEGADYD